MIAERFQAAVQRALAESAAARALCTRLAGRSLRIVVRHTPFTASIRSDGQTLRVGVATGGAEPAAIDAPAGADATLRGSALGLLAMLRADRRELVQRSVVEISGDTEIAEQFARLLTLLRPDLETLLGNAIGRAPAHVLATGAREAWRQGAQLLDNLTATTADYFMHERRELLSSAEAQQFYRQVDALQARVAQLEARVKARSAGARSGNTR
jgi:ubiquinone biosynthesis protein UbiJ